MNADIRAFAEAISASAETRSPRKILICTDFSHSASGAVEVAGELARLANAQVVLLHVYEPGLAGSLADGLSGNRRSTMSQLEWERLESCVNALRKDGIEAEAIFVEGTAKHVIISEIHAQGVDLVVLSTHGVTGVERGIFGSTAETVFRSATCPVLTVGPAVGRRPDVSKAGPIVFATDFHEPALEAAERAAALANLKHVTLHCIHVLPLDMKPVCENAIIPSIMAGALRKLTQNGAICAVEPSFAILYGAEISHSIVDYARLHDAETIVLGVHKTTEFVSHLPPQIVYRIILDAPCPVMTIPCASAEKTMRTAACV
jgi:nucleotide-binding universal stress UspA family protein